MSGFPFVLRASGHAYKGRRCQLVNPHAYMSQSNQVQVRFEDGFMAIVAKQTLRRGKGETNLVDAEGGVESKLAASPRLNEGKTKEKRYGTV